MLEVKIGDTILVRVKVKEIAETTKGKVYRGSLITEDDSRFIILALQPKDIVE
jgi:ribosomal protein L19